MRSSARLLATLAVALCMVLAGLPGAAQEAPGIVVADGVTQPVFSYEDAVREVVQVTSDVSTSDQGEPDIITVDIIRPRESGPDLKVPTIAIPSPYYSGPGRGRESQRKPTPPGTPSVVVGEDHHGGSLLSGSVPLLGQSGLLVDCGFARSADDCPENTEGAIALIQRDPDAPDTANAATAATVTCSYTSPWESCAAINSGVDPSSSNSTPRWGTWPETGAHWVELTWDEPRQLSVSDLYWFQDSQDGSNSGVKRAATWSLDYWDGAGWVPVPNPSGYGDALNQYNRTTFDPITTTRLRANLQTRSDAMGVGLMQWKVYAAAPEGGPTPVLNAEAAGAVGAVIYNHSDGPFEGSVSGDPSIPALAVDRAAGLALLEAAEDGESGDLRELVQPIDFFPLYYDNYFVPRGYAVALIDLPGSRYSTGCLDVGGPGEVGAVEAVIEFLAGNRSAVDGTSGQPVTADWSSGKVGLTGKSWDGTIPIAVAERAPEGLATIVPIAGLSHWHSDFWTNGTRYGGSPTQWFDGNSNNPSMAGSCVANRAHLAANQENPDPNSDFWLERNWVDDVGSFEASVFVVHGTNDYNVPPVNFGRLYEQLVEHDIPRKIWLSQVGHQKAFDFRREEWMTTIHRWYDRWLHGIDNGIDEEPRADVEHAPDEWKTYDDWPNGSTSTRLWFDRSDDAEDPRLYTLEPDAQSIGADSAGFNEIRRSVTQYAANPFAEDTDGQGRIRRLAFLSPPLEAPLHISGEAEVTLDVRLGGQNAQNTAFTAILVDYGTAPRRQHTASGEGVRTLSTRTCFGQGTEVDTGCFLDVEAQVHTPALEIVTRGNAQIGFVNDLDSVDPEQTYRLTFDLHHQDYEFAAGHRLGVIIAGPETRLHSNRHPTTNRPITLELGTSSVQLPVVGGHRALGEAFGYDEAERLAAIRTELDRLVDAGGITEGLSAKVVHALDMYEAWVDLPRKLGPALSHLERAIHLLEWQAGVVEKGKDNQGDPAGLRALAASIAALRETRLE